MKNANRGPIIYIEDDLDDRHIFKETISGLGISNEILYFDHGAHFLEYLYATPDQPLLIVCDINMPVMNGLELRKTLLADKELKKKSIPFIFYTTSVNPKEIEIAYDLTVQGYFKKASDMLEMKTTLKMIYDYWCICRHPNNFTDTK
ncbi:MAG: response regulator [Bacteroidota bacterium]|nr:response regulator [Ferruginibacter sp.]